MKKSFLLSAFALVICFSLTANAQIQYGGKIGLNFANIGGTNAATSYPGNGTRTGLVIGGFMSYEFAPMFAVEPEVLFSMKGTSGSTEGITYTGILNYIEVPVFLKFKIPLAPGSPVSANLYAGPDFAFKVASSIEETENGQSTTIDESSNTNGFDFGIAFGGGIGFRVGPTTLGLELRYTIGTGTVASNGIDITNDVFGLIASVGF